MRGGVRGWGGKEMRRVGETLVNNLKLRFFIRGRFEKLQFLKGKGVWTLVIGGILRSRGWIASLRQYKLRGVKDRIEEKW